MVPFLFGYNHVNAMSATCSYKYGTITVTFTIDENGEYKSSVQNTASGANGVSFDLNDIKKSDFFINPDDPSKGYKCDNNLRFKTQASGRSATYKFKFTDDTSYNFKYEKE